MTRRTAKQSLLKDGTQSIPLKHEFVSKALAARQGLSDAISGP